MTKKQAQKIIEQTQMDMNSKQDVLEGLKILARYDDNIMPSFEHDIIYACDFGLVAKMSVEEVTELARRGWICSEESWAHF